MNMNEFLNVCLQKNFYLFFIGIIVEYFLTKRSNWSYFFSLIEKKKLEQLTSWKIISYSENIATYLGKKHSFIRHTRVTIHRYDRSYEDPTIKFDVCWPNAHIIMVTVKAAASYRVLEITATKTQNPSHCSLTDHRRQTPRAQFYNLADDLMIGCNKKYKYII